MSNRVPDNNDLPNHIVRQFERRWAARLADEAITRRSEPKVVHQRSVVSRKGTIVQVIKKTRRPEAIWLYLPKADFMVGEALGWTELNLRTAAGAVGL